MIKIYKRANVPDCVFFGSFGENFVFRNRNSRNSGGEGAARRELARVSGRRGAAAKMKARPDLDRLRREFQPGRPARLEGIHHSRSSVRRLPSTLLRNVGVFRDVSVRVLYRAGFSRPNACARCSPIAFENWALIHLGRPPAHATSAVSPNVSRASHPVDKHQHFIVKAFPFRNLHI